MKLDLTPTRTKAPLSPTLAKRSAIFTAVLVATFGSQSLISQENPASAASIELSGAALPNQAGTAEIMMGQALASSDGTVTTVRISQKSQALVDAQHQEIDVMAERIKEMIEARYIAETRHQNAEVEIADLRDQLADLEGQLRTAQAYRTALESDKDNLNNRLVQTAADHDGAMNEIAQLKRDHESKDNAAQAKIKDRDNELARLGKQLENLAGEREKLTAQVHDLDNQLASGHHENGKLQARINRTATSLKAKQDDLARAKAELAKSNGEIDALNTRLADAKANAARLRAELKQTLANLDDTTRQRDDAQARVKMLKGNLAKAQEVNGERAQQLSLLGNVRQGLEQQLAGISSARDDLGNQKLALQKDLDDVIGQLARVDNERGKLKAQLSKAKAANESLDAENLDLESQLAALNKEHAILGQKHRGLQEQLADRVKANAELRAEKRTLANNLASLGDKHGLLDNAHTAVNKQLTSAIKDNKTVKVQNAALTGDLEDLTRAQQKLDKTHARLKKNHADLRDSNRKLDTQKRAIEAELAELSREHGDLNKSHERLKRQMADLSVARDKLQASKAELEQGIADRDRAVRDLNNRVTELGDEVTRLQVDSNWELAEHAQKNTNLSDQIKSLIGERDQLQVAARQQGVQLQSTEAQLQELGKTADAANAEINRLQGLIADYRQRLTAAEQAELAANEKAKQLGIELAETKGNLRIARSELNVLLREKSAAEAERDAILADAEKLSRSLTQELEAAKLENVTVQQTRADNSVPIRLGNADFFNPGSAKLTEEGSENLKKLAAIIATFEDRRIVVEGHTDTVPIGIKLRYRFESNWELSVARAAAAVRHMQNESNIDPTILSAVGYGEYKPMASNNTAEGRQMNRRVEVVLYPVEKEHTIYSVIDE